MKRVLALAVFTLLPVWGWGQHQGAKPHTVLAKVETKEARYARLDQYARSLPEAQAATLEKLAATLVTQARSDDDKARLIFSWLAYHVAYDAAYLKGDTTHSYAPEAVLHSRKAICQGYADLFTSLAFRMKLEARTVEGHARDWLTFDNMLSRAQGHAWNAYRVAGTWHLADATWGAGGLSFGDKEFESEFKPYWFDLPPAQSIFTHLPDSVSWQLLPTSVTPAAYQSWPYVEPFWFRLVSGTSLIRVFGAAKGTVHSLPIAEIDTKVNVLPVQVVQIPLQSDLISGRPIRFVFQAPSSVKLTVDLYDTLIELQPNGLYQQATVTPTGDQLTVRAWYKADSTSIFSLQYQVVPAPHIRKLQPGEHRKVVADSVMYMRR